MRMQYATEMSNPLSKSSMKFRLRFRIPFKVFNEYLVPKCVELNVFEMQKGVDPFLLNSSYW